MLFEFEFTFGSEIFLFTEQETINKSKLIDEKYFLNFVIIMLRINRWSISVIRVLAVFLAQVNTQSFEFRIFHSQKTNYC